LAWERKIRQYAMVEMSATRRASWLFPLVILALAALLLWLAPEERTLGSGIRTVYVHVALIWTGMAGLFAAGALGLFNIWAGRETVERRASAVAWVGLGAFAAGLAMSAVAADMNWGAMFWQEPRAVTALRVLGVGLIVQLAAGWRLPIRLKAGLRLFAGAFMVWSILAAPLVLHPADAARSSMSAAIRLTFLGMFALTLAAAGWAAIRLHRRQSGGEPAGRRA
jgi:hypothetical protein